MYSLADYSRKIIQLDIYLWAARKKFKNIDVFGMLIGNKDSKYLRDFLDLSDFPEYSAISRTLKEKRLLVIYLN